MMSFSYRDLTSTGDDDEYNDQRLPDKLSYPITNMDANTQTKNPQKTTKPRKASLRSLSRRDADDTVHRVAPCSTHVVIVRCTRSFFDNFSQHSFPNDGSDDDDEAILSMVLYIQKSQYTCVS